MPDQKLITHSKGKSLLISLAAMILVFRLFGLIGDYVDYGSES